ncbi:VWA domain-containing protein [Pseudoalteromonas sp. McH1-42]|uniref:vWA domain-containing protein n=1 Tax=Pseudoalteromonas sp. McH1-42 TaxID=2917752 RepID=UPI001EF515C9|nr:VWA domain-containing protein [Pseudoalteromonas sp. McH1-42]MCG7562327.1 VWA domain-containing protein [Pseudoalteromonas sp. McH1-42]
MTEFIFIRPALLWLLLPWLLLTGIQWIKRHRSNDGQLIAPHLAQFVLEDGPRKQGSSTPWLVSLLLLLSILAAAGPSFEKHTVPVFKSKQARVLVMDMSYSMYATDIQPNRLTQARFKTLDMIGQFTEGDTALVAYAGDAFVVSPLTDDIKTLENLVPSLSPEIMPSKGANVLAGLDQAKILLDQAGYADGEIILISDEVEQDELADISDLFNGTNYTLHVYGIGTLEGAPIGLPEGGFLKDRYGQIVVPKLDPERLSALASRQGGRYATYTHSDSDIKTFAPNKVTDLDSNEQPGEALWHLDAGKYLLFIIVPLALWLMRSQPLTLAILVVALIQPQVGYSADWSNWFKNQDQQALESYQQGDFEQAQSAQDPVLKGTALYKAGEYAQAAEQLKHATSAIGLYNYGNALAKSGQLDEAIAAYEQALQLDPDFTQAQDNKQLVEDLKAQQQESQQQNGDQSDNQNQSGDQQDQQQDGEQQQDGQQQGNDQQSDQQQESGQQQQGGEQQESNQQGEQQNGEQSDSDAQEQQSSDSDRAGQSDNDNAPELAQSAAQNEQQEQAEQSAQSAQQAQQQAADGEEQSERAQQLMQSRPLTPQEKEKAQQLDQLLRKVPDDPAILLRNKMLLESQQRVRQRHPRGVEKSW